MYYIKESREKGESIDSKLIPFLKKYGEKRFERALEIARAGRVKKHRFVPSNRALWSVVGREGDQFVDLFQSYCSCRHFHYRVIGGGYQICYHILSAKLAQIVEVYNEIVFSDEEYYSIIKAILSDIVIRKKDKESKIYTQLEPR